MNYKGNIAIICLTIFLIIEGCGKPNYKHHESMAQLEEAGNNGMENAQAAFDSLRRKSFEGLSESDRMYRNFLLVKLADKAFITHKNDSLILSVIKYYSRHETKVRYTEALYYGGRVYSDIGDYPLALKYYGEALDRTGDDYEGKVLKGKIWAQMGGLLNSMRLYDEAMRYINLVVNLDKEMKDTLNLRSDLVVSGLINKNLKNYDKAEYDFREAIKIDARNNPKKATVDSVYLADIKLNKGKLDSAVLLISSLPYKISEIYKGNNDKCQFVYSRAADIYRCAGMLDSAYKYAQKLIKIEDALNRRNGYAILLSDELKDVVPQDSIRKYLKRYKELTERYMESNGDWNALIQNSLYNYQTVERARQKAMEKRRMVERWLAVSVILLLLLAAGMIYYRYRTSQTVLRLRRALDNSRQLRRQLAQQPPAEAEIVREEKMKVKALRDALLKELLALCDSKKKRAPLSPAIIDSKGYAMLKQHIAEKSFIPADSPIWSELKQAILQASPDFDKRLKLLCPDWMDRDDYHMILMIKCGVTPTQLCWLVAKAKGTLSYRRVAIGEKLIGDKINPGMIDNLIYAL